MQAEKTLMLATRSCDPDPPWNTVLLCATGMHGLQNVGALRYKLEHQGRGWCLTIEVILPQKRTNSK